jgi:hypothetical protein
VWGTSKLEDWIIVDLKIYKSILFSINQQQKHDMYSSANSFATTTWNATKLPPKEVKVHELSNNTQVKET